MCRFSMGAVPTIPEKKKRMREGNPERIPSLLLHKRRSEYQIVIIYFASPHFGIPWNDSTILLCIIVSNNLVRIENVIKHISYLDGCGSRKFTICINTIFPCRSCVRNCTTPHRHNVTRRTRSDSYSYNILLRC